MDDFAYLFQLSYHLISGVRFSSIFRHLLFAVTVCAIRCKNLVLLLVLIMLLYQSCGLTLTMSCRLNITFQARDSPHTFNA